MQIAKDLTAYAKYLPNVHVVAVYGGASMDTQIRALDRGAQIVVGTPGRTLDLVDRKRLKLQNVQWLVLDEADEMLNMGFKDDLDAILSSTPSSKQTLLFSATMPDEVSRIAREYMKSAKEIKVGTKNAGTENVSHEFYVVRASDKYQALKRIADINPDIYGIVFCRTRKDTQEIAEKLIEDGYNADSLHGDLSQAQRDTVMQRFRIRNLQILVATDVAARGLDVNSLSHVINYSLPDDPEIYIHRSGRTGRAGKKGLSLSIVHSKEMNKIKALERMVKRPFEKVLVPGGAEIVEKRLYNLIDNIKLIEVDEHKIEPFLADIMSKFEDISREEIIKKFVSVEFNQFLNYYKGAQDLNLHTRDNDRDYGAKEGRSRDRNERTDRGERGDRGDRGDRGERGERGERSDRGGRFSKTEFSRFYINIGTTQSVSSSSLIGIINDHLQNRTVEIGRIDLMKRFSFFEIDKKYEKALIESFKNTEYKGERVILEQTNSTPPPKEEGYGARRNRKPNESGTSERSSYSDRGSKERSTSDRSGSDRGSNDRYSDRNKSRGSSHENGKSYSDKPSNSAPRKKFKPADQKNKGKRRDNR
jgi:ATP-dependent RNA helicase DeaD